MSAGPSAFVGYLLEKRPQIEAYIASRLPHPLTDEALVAPSLERYLYEPLARFTAGGGKRIRPALALLGCEAVGGDPARALSSAAAIELFQSAALIHDDIADEGELRRGVPCLHRSDGTGVAINVGDLALVCVQTLVLRDETLPSGLRLRLMGELLSMEERTLEGQALDLGWVRDDRWDVSSAEYLTMAAHKTGFYSAAIPLAVGALCGDASPEQVEDLSAFGMAAGLAFQLQDDLLNLVGDASAQGKDFRSDITEGKRTLVVCHALEHLDADAREELVSILSAHSSDEAPLARATELMEDAGSIDFARGYAQSLASDAKERLDGADVTEGSRELLLSMTDYFIGRSS